MGYTYDKDGNLSERKVPGNNLTTTYAYDYQNRLTRMKNQTGSAGVVSKYSSEYLENGQKSKEVSGGSWQRWEEAEQYRHLHL